jgi:hypothetical protein
MENRKDIGKIFREKIDYLDKEPNNDGWNAIQSELDKKKKKRLIFIPFWFKTIGLLTAGSLCLWLITNHTFENAPFLEKNAKPSDTPLNDTSSNNKTNSSMASEKNTKSREATTAIPTVNVATDTALNSKRTGIHRKTGEHNSNNTTLAGLMTDSKISTTYKRKRSANNEKTKPATKSNSSHNKKSKTKSHKTKINNQNSGKAVKNTKAENQDKPTNNTLHMGAVAAVATSELDKNQSVKNNDPKNNKKEILKATEEDTIANPEIKEKSFEVFVYGSPTLSGLNKNKSLLDNRLNNNATTSNVTFSYGAYFCYQGTANFSLRLGLGLINLNLITQDVPVNTTSYSNINYSKGMSNAYIYSQSNNSEYMKIIQEISYIEIPLEAKYRIIHQKFGINAIMGINYLFLNNNEITAKTTDGSTFKIGNTANLMDRTVGLNFGMGFEYNLTKKIKLNMEPMFKYHFKNSQDDNESKLLSMNVLTGLQIKFGK